MLIIWYYVLLLNLYPIRAGYIEPVTASGCESCRIYLTCRHLTSVIAIFEVDFIPELINTDNNTVETSTIFPVIHPRESINQRCSGGNHCSFILNEDCPGAAAWGKGTLFIRYVCISEDRIKKYCNSEIVLPEQNNIGISEGFIHNPGYPRFYAGHRNCRWKITAPIQQRVRLKLLDISVYVDNAVFPDECSEDRLEILDSDQLIYSTCHQKEPPTEIISQSDSLEIALLSSETLNPLRGILLYYTAVGCATPKAPADGYLIYRNDSVAEFSCCVGFVFPDTGFRTRLLICLNSRWDGGPFLPNCQRLHPPTETSKLPISNMNTDVIAPALLIVALFLINSIIIFYIYKAKQKQVVDIKDEEIGALRLTEQNTQAIV